jgi:DNA-binding CsgD family transcriptional regulator
MQMTKNIPLTEATPGEDNVLTDLFRKIVECVAPASSKHEQTHQILLETTVEGSRYLLVRLPRAEGSGPALSPREEEIVRMVSQGYPNKVIAAVLNISSWTVSTHLRRIFAKLGVTSRAAMVAQVLEVRATGDQRSLPPANQHMRRTG